MKIKNLCVSAGLCAGVASAAFGQAGSGLEQADFGMKMEPLRFAKVAMQDGKMVFQSDWMDYNGGSNRATGVRIFDCYGDIDSDGTPDGGVDCGYGTEGTRLYRGENACNMFTTGDMTVACDTVIEDGATRVSFGWFWTVEGSFTTETCVVAIFTQEGVPCSDPDSFDYSGFLLDFGSLESSVGGGYYTADFELTSGAWTLPVSGTGSYLQYFLSEVTSSGDYVFATCAQPMLWGTGDAGGAPDNRGTQSRFQYEDRREPFGEHAQECYRYGPDGTCPSVRGAMTQFWGNTDLELCNADPCLDGFANCNGDDAVNTQDFLCFLGIWSASFQSGNYDAAADCNEDGEINTQDFLCFLGEWAACQ